MHIWYISRSYPPPETGGSLARQAQVAMLRAAGFTVTVVTPDYTGSPTRYIEGVLRVPFVQLRRHTLAERFGLMDDYMRPWINRCLKEIAPRATEADLFLATTGGELGCFKLAQALATVCGKPYALCYHDPVDYSIYNGLRLDRKFHVSREQEEYRLLQQAAMVWTSSQALAQALLARHPDLAPVLLPALFGIVQLVEPGHDAPDSASLCFGYGGSFSILQRPEWLAQVVIDLPKQLNAQGVFMGSHAHYAPIRPHVHHPRLHFSGPLPRLDFLQRCRDVVHVGYLSLSNAYLGVCVPSKLFEYINLGLPMLAALAPGDARSIIEEKGYGLCADPGDMPTLSAHARRFVEDRALYHACRARVLADRSHWLMPELAVPVINKLQQLMLPQTAAE